MSMDGWIKSLHFLGKKCQKNAVLHTLGLCLARYWHSDFRFWRFILFGNNKVVLVSGFLVKIKKRHFLAEKRLFLRKKCHFPFSIAFLWSLYSWIGPNFQNLLRNFDFGRNMTLRSHPLGKTEKNQKTVLPDTFSFLFLIGRNNDRSSWSFVILAIFGHFWPKTQFFYLGQKTRN